MKDPYFTLNLVKEQNDYIVPNGDRLKYLYHNNQGNDVYVLPNSKRKEITPSLSIQKFQIKIGY